ncbi:nitrate reductase cytochrome c-type subunit [Nitratiruptor sp. YY09-18]|uniref:nitrate reductase cytochrome c-type subunit n=1 Tax=Nitratiruptor sp. YY09-18 TaxID=2724901 RepID=UPI0019152BE3|nr:nitrate reductase cytochrome c-type subunit [Nitratiruptor sp. YY09-18]BCD68883.1 cytochrome c-type protein NapB [Nitratiruptor sp. YY09-18]
MKVKGLIAMAAATALFAATFAFAGSKVVTEDQLSYGSKGTPPKVEYSKAAPGTSKRFQRSYENAPPMIPHSIDGLLPITLDHNACLGCHMPSVAKSMGATPLPPTHFKDFFFATKKKLIKQKLYEDKKAYEKRLALMAKKKDIAPQRYNCVQCHAPQANAHPLVSNTFKPDFRNVENKKHSTLYKNLMEGVK